MISTGQIVAAGVMTGLGVAIAAWALSWPRVAGLLAAVLALALILAWRGVSNVLSLNGDFLPAVSVGDVGCLVVGALAPLTVAGLFRVPKRRWWLPILVGGVAAFLVNVVIL
jgi:hypothetical protein